MKTRKINEEILIGIPIVLLTAIINLGPYLFISKNPFWVLSLMIDNMLWYYVMNCIVLLPMGTIISAIVGNRITGGLTFVLTGIVFILRGDVANVAVSFWALAVCVLIYDNQRINRLIASAITIILTSLGMNVLGNYLDDALDYLKWKAILCFLVMTAIIVVISVLIEKLPLFKGFDKKSKDLDRNYRVHSINRKLMLIINVICLVLILMFSVMSVLFLGQKEKERKTSEENIWEVVLYNAIKDDADIYAEHDIEKIKAESTKFQEALQIGNIEVPAYIVLTTNVNDKYLRQFYEVTRAGYGVDGTYKYNVEWTHEYQMTEQDLERMYFVPSDGNSSLIVSESSRLWESSVNAIKQILAVAVMLMVLMNILVEAFIRKNIVRPINQMTTEAVNFAFREDDSGAAVEGEPADKNKRIEIMSGDEIESLCRAFHKTMDDVELYIEDVREKSEQVSDMQHNIIITMADIIESRDMNTGGHIKRTALYVEIVANKLMKDGAFEDILTQDYIDDMIVAAPLHDMGKIHVPDGILNKEGKLSESEYDIMKTHASVGKKLLDDASESLGEFKYLIIAKQMAESHHEWWNGNGYPQKIAGEDIPLCARIMAVADVFDALVSKRCYKEPMDLDVAFGIIEKETGTHFDPVVGKAFLECRPEVEETLSRIAK